MIIPVEYIRTLLGHAADDQRIAVGQKVKSTRTAEGTLLKVGDKEFLIPRKRG